MANIAWFVLHFSIIPEFLLKIHSFKAILGILACTLKAIFSESQDWKVIKNMFLKAGNYGVSSGMLSL